jgi:prepilin-type N-terminal cleavage/methylation domain-containing protein
MKKFLRRRTKHGAFSLLEVSVVLIIVGIFTAGIFIADGMIKKFRITAAQSLTKSSPIAGINDSALWLESSLDTAFSNSEAETGTALSGW